MDHLRFEQPLFLWLILLVIPLVIAGLGYLTAFDWLRRMTILFFRAVLLSGVAIILAGPHFERTHDHVTVIGVLDVSGSVRRFADLPWTSHASLPGADENDIRSNVEYLRWWLREAARDRAPDDRLGLVVFDGRAIAIATPRREALGENTIALTEIEGTDITSAIQLALAMFPADTAKRIVLMSDGNETMGSALEAARSAAGRSDVDAPKSGRDARTPHAGVPIDVAPVSYRIEDDVQIVRVDVPPNARPEQVVTVRIVLESIRPVDGWLTLLHEERPVDINGEREGFRRGVSLPAGASVHTAQVLLANGPVQRFEAVFEPVDAAADVLPENNRASAFVATPGRGKVAIVRRDESTAEQRLERTLRAAGIDVEVLPPSRVPSDLLRLQAYDLIVLENVPASEFDESMQRLLARYVNDFGGGLIMTGGERSFGAGGWNGTPIEEVLPLELDLPKELRVNQAALVLVMDKSGSMAMNVAGSRATQQEIANRGVAEAIRSLQAESLVGVVVFDSFTSVRVPLGPNDDPQRSVDRVMGISPGGGTFMGPGLAKAHEMLRNADVKRKYVVVLSDGHSEGRDSLEGIVAAMAADGIVVSSIAVGDEADREMLARLAEVGDGEFHDVINPAMLPRVLVDSVQIVNKPLIKIATVIPVPQPTGSALAAGLTNAPPLEGLVLTAPRNDPLVSMELITAENEPLLAHWQAGLGRAAAFTSDVNGEWSRRWANWPGYGALWTQLVRMISRPATNHDYELATLIDEGTLKINLRAADQEGAPLDFLSIGGTVYAPDGEEVEISLHQSGPGEYAAEIPASESGNYIVALLPRQGTQALPPVVGGANLPGGIEYRRYQSNVALLQRIAEETGGRLLDLRAPDAAKLFNRDGLPRSTSMLPIWQMLLWFVIGLMLLDVAARRVAWDSGTIRRAWHAAMRRVAPARIKAAEAEATLAVLRARGEVLSESSEREFIADEVRHRDELAARAAATQPPAMDETTVRARVEAALDALEGKSRKPARAASPSPEPEPIADESAPTATTSGLLAAKRRVREKLAGQSDQSDSSPSL